MPRRKDSLMVGETYHIMTKSISGYVVFNSTRDYERIFDALKYYRYGIKGLRFSHRHLNICDRKNGTDSDYPVSIIAYCIMPTHVHFVLRQEQDGGISGFMKAVLNSYSLYFNTKYKRKGPLWEGRFKSVHVKDDDQLLHLTRYLHLNPVTAGKVRRPAEWSFSSFEEYVGSRGQDGKVCEFSDLVDIDVQEYERFVMDRKGYQKELAKIRAIILE